MNFYLDELLRVECPYPYYEWIREQGPVWRAPYEDVAVVTGYDDIWEIDRDRRPTLRYLRDRTVPAVGVHAGR